MPAFECRFMRFPGTAKRRIFYGIGGKVYCPTPYFRNRMVIDFDNTVFA
jgi:hypothetical protein